MAETGNSNQITRDYIDSLLIETRYMNSCCPDTTFTLFNEQFSSPIMTAALSHMDHFMFPGAADALARGARDAGAVLWYGMADQEEIDRLADSGARMIEVIKPYKDRDLIQRKIRHAEDKGLLAVGIDIDHAFSEDGSNDVVNGYEMKAVSTAELTEICRSTSLPLIVKGVLSTRDAEYCLEAGAAGLLLSHHNNRIRFAIPPMMLLPEIIKMTNNRVPVFIDCEIRDGMDAFKALALGAAGVCIGRPLMTAIKQDQENGVRDYISKAVRELKKTMAYTGCTDLRKMDPTVIHRI